MNWLPLLERARERKKYKTNDTIIRINIKSRR
jgi:hypothetical protein